MPLPESGSPVKVYVESAPEVKAFVYQDLVAPVVSGCCLGAFA